MSFILSKKQDGKTYYYLAESARVEGKPRIVSQRYLGSAEEIAARLSEAGPGDPDPGVNTSDCYQPGIGRSWYPAHQRTGPLPRRVGNWCASHPPTRGSDRLIDDRQMRAARLPGCQIYLARLWVLLTMSISHHRS